MHSSVVSLLGVGSDVAPRPGSPFFMLGLPGTSDDDTRLACDPTRLGLSFFPLGFMDVCVCVCVCLCVHRVPTCVSGRFAANRTGQDRNRTDPNKTPRHSAPPNSADGDPPNRAPA